MRGEAEVTLGGARRVLRLTLGGLARMEAALGVAGTAELAERLGRLSAGDLVRVLEAIEPGLEAETLDPAEAAAALTAVFRAAAA